MKKVFSVLLTLLVLLSLATAPAMAAEGTSLLWDIPYGVDAATFTELALKNANVTVQPSTEPLMENISDWLILAPDAKVTFLGQTVAKGDFRFIAAPADGSAPVGGITGFDQGELTFALESPADVTAAIALLTGAFNAAQGAYGAPELTLLTYSDGTGDAETFRSLPLLKGEPDAGTLASAMEALDAGQYTLQFGTVALCLEREAGAYSVSVLFTAEPTFDVTMFSDAPAYSAAHATKTDSLQVGAA